VSETLGDLARESLSLVGFAVLLFYYDARLAMVCLTGAPLVVYPLVRLGQRVRRTTRRSQEALEQITHVSAEAFTGHRIVKAFGAEQRETRKFQRASDFLYRTTMKVTSALSVLPPLMEFIGGVAFAVALWYGSQEIGAGRLTTGSFVAFIAALFMMYGPAKKLSRVNANLQQAIAASERIFEMLDTHSEVRERDAATDLARFKDVIEFRDVQFSYEGAEDATLRGVSFSVRGGQTLAIVGRSGAGKTTLVNLLTGLLVPSKGEVYFRGRNIAGVGPVMLAAHGMARTFQLVQIFPQLTAAETIAAAVVTRQGKRWRLFSPLLADREIAARTADIAGIFGLEHRLDTPSRLLSQGEKKLLDVASAFALDPQVILLDEPTSGVSTAEKHTLMKTLVSAARAAGVKAIILVEHDMDLVASYSHRIIALSEGRVLADLPPDTFFADPVIIETVVGKRRGH
jgi:ABC-type multidrug transport system fused ATPase/permease subunit